MHWIYLNTFILFLLYVHTTIRSKIFQFKLLFYYQVKDKWKILIMYVRGEWMRWDNFTKRLSFIFRFVKYTNFIKRSKNIKEKKENTDTRSHCCVTSRAEYKPPLGMHVALSFKEVHEVGEWEIMPSTRFLSAAGKHNLPPLFFSPSFFFSFLKFPFLPFSSFVHLHPSD